MLKVCCASSGKPHPVTYLPPSCLSLSLSVAYLSVVFYLFFLCTRLSLPCDCLKQTERSDPASALSSLSLRLSLRQPLWFHTTDWRIHLRRGKGKEEGDDREAGRRRRKGRGAFCGKYQSQRKGRTAGRLASVVSGVKDLRKGGQINNLLGRKMWSR